MTSVDWLLVLGQLPWFGWVELTVNSLLRLLEVTLVWPVAAVVIALVFRQPLVRLLMDLRVGKAGSFELWLARAQESLPAPPDPDASDTEPDPPAPPAPPTPPSAPTGPAPTGPTPQPSEQAEEERGQTTGTPNKSQSSESLPDENVHRHVITFVTESRQRWRRDLANLRNEAVHGNLHPSTGIDLIWLNFEQRVTSEYERVTQYAAAWGAKVKYPPGWSRSRADLHNATQAPDRDDVSPVTVLNFAKTVDELYGIHSQALEYTLSQARRARIRYAAQVSGGEVVEVFPTDSSTSRASNESTGGNRG